jgi:hypothetical protein
LTELADPLVADAVAQIRDHLAAGTPCIVLSAPAGAGKSAILSALFTERTVQSSGRSVKRRIAELDQLHSDLERSDGWGLIYESAEYVSPARPNAVTVPTASIALSPKATDLP